MSCKLAPPYLRHHQLSNGQPPQHLFSFLDSGELFSPLSPSSVVFYIHDSICDGSASSKRRDSPTTFTGTTSVLHLPCAISYHQL